MLLDLVERGVHLIPSATAQTASKSKCFQAKIFSPWMVPETTVIYNIHSLLEKTNRYHEKKITKVVVKHDQKNGGIGILLYNSIEDVYNQAANNALPFPFVLQPFITNSVDIRVIIIDDYIEAYRRSTPYNFRNNLHCGGSATPLTLSKKCLDLCKEVMERGNFPHGHLDLMLPETGGDVYLAEINLRGGIRGAQITTVEYNKKISLLEEKLLNNLQQHKKRDYSDKNECLMDEQ